MASIETGAALTRSLVALRCSFPWGEAMRKYLMFYLATAIVLVVLDGVWLGLVARDFFRARLGHVMLPEVNLWVAGLFYLLYPVGVVIFTSTPALTSRSWTTAVLYGALFGFFAYATYDLTNLATLRGWPLSVAILDVSWGTLVSAVSAAAGYLLADLVSPLR
jgi:uncharacterized membrane protein